MNEFSKYLVGVKAKTGIKSDNQLALHLGIAQSAVQGWSKGRTPEDDTCIKIAKLAGDDPAQVLLLVHKVKASAASKPYWDKIFKTCAAAVLVFVLVMPLALPSPAANGLETVLHNVYYVKLCVLYLVAFIAAVFSSYNFSSNIYTKKT